MSFPVYPKYKDSGIEWLAKVPVHWKVVKLGYLAISKGGGTPPKDELQYWNGSIPWVTPKDMKQQWITSTIDNLSDKALPISPVSMIEPGHVLIVFRSGILRHRIPSAINKVPLTVNQDVRAYNVRPRLLPDFFLRIIQGLNRELLPEWSKQGATVESLDSELVNSTQLPIPPQSEQAAIVAFLDHETARIDALIDEQKRLIELLKEKRQAVISHAVTKGLDPDVPMKESGVEWVGEVPSHWSLPKKLDHVALDESHSFVNGPFGSDLLANELQSSGVPVIYIRDLKTKGYTRISKCFVTQEKAKQIAFCNVQPFDVLIAKVGDPPGLAVTYPANEPSAVITQDVIRIRPSNLRVNPHFLTYMINSETGRVAIDQISVVSTRTRISLGDFKQLRFCWPPLNEQKAISNYLSCQLRMISNMINEANKGVELFTERRSALISAAVTGKIDVRNWQPSQAAEQTELPMVAESRATYR